MPSLRALYDALPWRRRVNGHGPADTAAILGVQRDESRHDLASTPPPNVAMARAGGPDSPVAVPPTNGKEYGVSGTAFFGGTIKSDDQNPDFDNFVSASQIYDKMRRTDAQVRSMLQVLKLPLRGATWQALPADDSDGVDRAIADFVNETIFADEAMEIPWDRVLNHALLQLEFGFSVSEIVFRVDDEGTYRIQRLAPRLPKTIRYWNVDRNGRLLAIVQYAPVPSSTVKPTTSTALAGGSGRMWTATDLRDVSAISPYQYITNTQYQYLTIPADSAVVFTLDREGDQYEGNSLLRTVWRNYEFKSQAYHLEGVRLDRWGVGIPVASLTTEAALTQDDLNELVDILKKVRSNERAFLIAPPGVSYDLLPRGSTGGSSSNQAVDWINHHDSQIARNVLAGFLTMGQDPHGTLGFGSRLTDLFVSSLNGVAQGICADLKHQVAVRLCKLNFNMEHRAFPRITVRDLEQVDLNNLVSALNAFAGGGFIQPDDDTEDLLRKILQLPPLAAEMTRKSKAQAQPGTAAAATVAEQVTSGQSSGDLTTPQGPVPPSASYVEDAGATAAKPPQQASLFPPA